MYFYSSVSYLQMKMVSNHNSFTFNGFFSEKTLVFYCPAVSCGKHDSEQLILCMIPLVLWQDLLHWQKNKKRTIPLGIVKDPPIQLEQDRSVVSICSMAKQHKSRGICFWKMLRVPSQFFLGGAGGGSWLELSLIAFLQNLQGPLSRTYIVIKFSQIQKLYTFP